MQRGSASEACRLPASAVQSLDAGIEAKADRANRVCLGDDSIRTHTLISKGISKGVEAGKDPILYHQN